MSISQSELCKEEAYLDRVMQVLERELIKSRDIVTNAKNEVMTIHKEMMDDIGNDIQSLGKFVDAYAYLVEIDNRAYAMNQHESEHKRLVRMADSPYFARMDFALHGGKPMPVYIGIGSLIDNDKMDFYVFDWRSPLAGMYYDYELGPASYAAPQGRVEGEVSLKRHFKIWRGKIESVYDSSLAIEDDMLQEALSKSADSKMQTIVYTIQKEQNQVIRDTKSRVLIAFGPAGSGKTSVAMQRVAFFLYTYRKEITAENIMIFSPTQLFGDYISEVLPQLGEENIKSVTFNSFVSGLFEGQYRFVVNSELLEFAAKSQEGIRKKAIELKLSPQFTTALADYAERLAKQGPKFSDAIYNGKVIMSKTDMEKLYREDYAYLKPQSRLNKMYSRVLALSKDAKKLHKKALLEGVDTDQDPLVVREQKIRAGWAARCAYNEFCDRVQRMLTIDAAECYLDVLESCDRKIYEYTRERLADKLVTSEDAPALGYLYAATHEVKNEIKYLVIDEGQDYTPLHYACIKECFKKASITILGDTNQALNPHAPLCRAEDIAEVFDDASIVRLSKSYRSTRQISEFCGRILGLSDQNYMNRDGDEVQELIFKNTAERDAAIIDAVNDLRRQNRTVAVIAPTAEECARIHQAIGKKTGAHLITSAQTQFVTSAVVIPAYMAKGLEFDAVIVPKECFNEEWLKYIYYTACTRALHILKIYDVKAQG